MRTEILWKFVYLYMFEKSKSWGKFVFVKKKVLIKLVKRGQYLKKKVFLLKVSHLELNYAFLLFWSILGEI